MKDRPTQAVIPGARLAFSLVELVMVVMIIGLLASIAVPRFANAISHHRVEAAAQRICVDLEHARQHAIQTSKSQTVTFNVAQDSYRLIGMRSLRSSTVDYSVSLSSEPYEVTIVSADFGGNPDVIFDMYGDPDSGGSVLVAAGRWQKTVTLDPDTAEATVE